MISVLHLKLPNVFLITGEKSILVDTGTPSDTDRILQFLKAQGLDVRDLALILHTHGHWDHAGSTAQLKTLTHAPVAIHRADADLLRRGTNGPLKPTNLTGRLLRPILDRPFPPVEPDLLIDEEINLSGFGVPARIVFTPGHTPGSISVVTQDNEIIVGDLLIGGIFGGLLFPNRPGLHYYADDLTQVWASVEKVIEMSPRVIYSSHGGPFDASDVARWCRRD